MGGRHFGWLTRACVAVLMLLPVGEDSPHPYRPRALSLRHAAGESLLVSVGPGGVALRSEGSVASLDEARVARPPSSRAAQPPADQPRQPALAPAEPPHRARTVAQAMPPCQAELWLAG